MTWAMLPEETAHAVMMLIGGERLGETAQLREVCHHFRGLADRAMLCHLHGPDASMRFVALEAAIAAAEHGIEAALHRVIGRARDEDATVRQLALSALHYLVVKGDAEVPMALQAAAEALSDDEHDDVFAAARVLLVDLAERGDRRVIATVIAAARARPEALGALGAVAERGDEEALAAILRALSGSCDESKREAVAALGEVAPHGCLEATNRLCELIMDPDTFTCQAALTACMAIAPRSHEEAVRALTSRLGDHRPSVRGKALEALGVIAEPGAEVAAAVERLREDQDERVRGLAEDLAAKLAPVPEPEAEPLELALGQPPAIAGVKSRKASLVKLEQDAEKGDDRGLTSLAISLSSTVVLAGSERSRALALLRGEGDCEQATLASWRHPCAHVAFVSHHVLGSVAEDDSGRTPAERLLEAAQRLSASPDDSPGASAPSQQAFGKDAAEAHLQKFGLGGGALCTAAASLPPPLLGRLALAEAFWPRSPHVLVLDAPEAWGLSRRDLDALTQALRGYAGGVVVATEDNELAATLEGERWACEGGVLRRDG